MGDAYQDFLASKARIQHGDGIDAVPSSRLYPFQRDLVRWALKRGRAALFADTGLGKTAMQLDWSRVVQASKPGSRVIILAPLAVAAQTAREGARFDVDVKHVRDGSETHGPGIYVTNYDRLHLFDPSAFHGVVLDESSCLKDFTSATRNLLIECFNRTPFRLCCTATPAPNDFTEIGNHAEFLGVMTRTEMLSMFFVHDGGSTQDWRVKGHAEHAFWRWVCSWGALVKHPRDLGYDAAEFDLPPLTMHEHVVPATVEQAHAMGMLFAESAKTLQEQRGARRASIDDRVRICAELVAREPNEPWAIWCELNAEGDALTDAIPGAVQVAGADSADHKESTLLGFSTGTPRILVSKASIAGWGMNWQHCARTAFVGVGHSFEAFYQALRRFWRFGQAREVIAHVITSEVEGDVLRNLQRKQADAERMAKAMAQHTQEVVTANVRGTQRDSTGYNPQQSMEVPSWLRTE